MTPNAEWYLELEMLLDELSYEISNARTLSLKDPDNLRDVLKRMRDKVASAEALASAAGASRREHQSQEDSV